jgi:phospho-N-acetylmuramoyl-pentapeptide-transferase
LFIGLLIGPKFINMLRVRQGKGQPIRDDGPQTHKAKVGTPTMGGLMILTSLVILDADLDESGDAARLGLPRRDYRFGLIGFLDDFDKVTKRSHKGVSGRVACCSSSSSPAWATWVDRRAGSTNVYVPFLFDQEVPLGVSITPSRQR